MWDGDEWEYYARQLLIARYGARYQAVPDRDRGDWGIEGYLADEGTVFQCYAPEDPRDLDDHYKKLRSKMTADLTKLLQNRKEIRNAVGIEIRRWILLTPDSDTKRILTHAGNKQAEIRGKNHKELSPEFAIGVQTHRDFETEKRQIETNRLRLANSEVDLSAGLENQQLLDGLRVKLQAMNPVEDPTPTIVDYYLRGRDLQGRVRSAFPAIGTELEEFVASRERALVVASQLGETDQYESLAALTDELAAQLDDVVALPVGQRLDLAWGVVADWLIRCPLTPRPVDA